MALTTNLNLIDPTVGADSDVWGGYLNSNWDSLDALLNSVITGLTLSAAGATATFGIALGSANGMKLASAYTKTASAWAVGTGTGSLDTGAIANSTWYHVWLIQRTDTSVVDILTSLSATAPTMPTNYTRKRRIGAMKTDGSAQWVKFVQVGDEFLWSVPVNDFSGNATTTATLQTVSVPTGVKVTALIRGYAVDATINLSALISSPDETSGASNSPSGNVTVVTQVSNQASHYGQIGIRTNTSGQVRHVASATINNLLITTRGWIDPRGQF